METSEAFATTRAASRRRVEEEREQARREKSSGVQPKPVLAEQPKESWDLGAELDEAIFQGGRQRPTQTRSQKRQKRQELSRKNCTGRKLYRALHFWLPNLYRPGTLLVAKSVPALPKVYRPRYNFGNQKCTGVAKSLPC